MSKSKKVIGIDLGTGNSCVAVMEGNKPVVIVNKEGYRTTPSMVGFGADGEVKVGGAAKRQAITNAENTVFSIKRFMGETYDEVSEEIKRVPYKVEKDGEMPKINIGGRLYTPQEISASILQEMKKSAEDYLREEVTDAVITVPAYFSDAQRQATKDAGKIAGLNVRRIINEPTAAALAYGIDKNKNDKRIAVFDLGQGTFDISILEVGDGVFEVNSTNGDTHLGGDDFDQKIIDWLVAEFKAENGVDLSKDPIALQRLKEAAEKAKIELSSQNSTEINLPYITATQNGPIHLVKSLTRAKFESLIDDLIGRLAGPCETAIKDSNASRDEIDEVLLVGGSTRVPAVREAVKKIFGKEASNGVNPDEAVALGAAIQGGILAGEVTDVLLLDVTPLSLGIDTLGGIMAKVIEANTTIPCKRSQIFTTAENNQPAVTIVVAQGNRPMTKDNKQIGVFTLDGIAPAPRGVPQIEVTFDIDTNGILSVSATDKATGKEQHITIEAKSSLSDADIERMKKEAEEHAEEDKKAEEEARVINDADSFAFAVEKAIQESGDKITDDEKKSLEAKIKEIRDAVSEKDVVKIGTLMTSLNELWTPIVSRIYQSTSGATADGGNSNPFAGTGFDFGGNNPFSGNKQ